jgi:NAD(P)-dependent dehydrogenase (short-subunit alcohol dehydrogenase family)
VEVNGRIIVIGSVSKTGGMAGFGLYASTKAATETLSRALAIELGHKGVTVNTIHPGNDLKSLLLPSLSLSINSHRYDMFVNDKGEPILVMYIHPSITLTNLHT